MNTYYRTLSGALITEDDIRRAYKTAPAGVSYARFLNGCGAVEINPTVDDLVKAGRLSEAADLFNGRYNCGYERARNTIQMMRIALCA